MWVQGFGQEDDNPLQYSCLENPTDRGAWQAIVGRVTKSGTRLKPLSRQALMKVSGSELGMGEPC